MAEQVAVVHLRPPAELPHRVAELGIDERVDHHRRAALRTVDGELQVVDRLDSRMADDLELGVGKLRLECEHQPRRSLAGGVGHDVQLDRLLRHARSVACLDNLTRVTEIAQPVTMDKIVSLCRRRGFVFPSSEIYGGLGSTYDYGHYGVLTKNNIRELWFKAMVQEREDIVAIDSAIILHPRVWEASGHVSGFTDPLIDCRTCKLRFREDQIGVSACGRKPSKHPGEFSECDLTEARQFNLMFTTHVGALEDESSLAYLRPETAQGIFINFKNVLQVARRKPPFGIAQIGKAFRNEITPGNFLFRVREFEQMEMEYFVPPDDAARWHEYWIKERYDWHVKYGLRESQLRIREHDASERSHYSSATSDIEYLYPIGWSELEGVANRG